MISLEKNYACQIIDQSKMGQVLELLHKTESFDNSGTRTGPGDLLQMLAPQKEFCCLGISHKSDPEKLIGYAYVCLVGSEKNQCHCEGAVHPDYRNQNLGKQLLVWQVNAAKLLLKKNYPTQKCSIIYTAPSTNNLLHRLLQSLGFIWTESYVDMSKDLIHLPPMPRLGDNIQLTTWDISTDHLVRESLNYLRVKNGKPPRSLSEWQAARGRNFDSRWSYLALDTSYDRLRLAGYIQASNYPSENSYDSFGYIDRSGVFERYSSNILEALLILSLSSQAKSGLKQTKIGINPDEFPFTYDLYRKLGFRDEMRNRTYVLTITV